MRILALNVSHDASVCSINDGAIEFFCKEERLSRKKHDKAPFLSIQLYKSLNLGKVDHIVYCCASRESTKEINVQELHYSFLSKIFDVPEKNFTHYPHHISHAYLAYANSKFSEALVVVIDRNGSVIVVDKEDAARESESVFHFYKTGFKQLYKNYWVINPKADKSKIRKQINANCDISIRSRFSIVKVYEAATTLIGQDELENGKTMGLSSYGTKQTYEPLFVDNVPVDNYFDHVDEKVIFRGMHDLINSSITEDNYQLYADKAKQVQLETQKAALKLIKKYVEKTGITNVCVVGGYALNIVANNFYLKNLPQVNFYFEPVADDTGISIGAAMMKHHQETKTFANPLENNFYHYYDDSEKIITGKNSSIDELCSLLIDQKSVALFEGNPEVGPRALGHRSILFDPRNINAKEIINKIKKREWYRPFAGVILQSEFEKYFETLGISSSPYMTINFNCLNHTVEFVPGITHIDNTCRIQTVSDGFLFDLLTAFYKKTKCPMLLNTSFNLAGEPLIQTKAQALQMLQDSELDAVFFVDDQKLVVK